LETSGVASDSSGAASETSDTTSERSGAMSDPQPGVAAVLGRGTIPPARGPIRFFFRSRIATGFLLRP
jgi:hypothetical protein